MEIHNLSTSLNGSEILMIDGLLEEANEWSRGSIAKAWEEEEARSGSSGRGMYPPPSLHSLLNMFLLPDVPTTTKHRIVQYLFLDLASLLSDGWVVSLYFFICIFVPILGLTPHCFLFWWLVLVLLYVFLLLHSSFCCSLHSLYLPCL